MTTTFPKSRCAISRENFADMATVYVKLGSDDMTIAAYEHTRTPAVLLTKDTFHRDLSTNQKIEFETISLDGFEGYEIWCCEIIDGSELRVCLVR